MHLSMSQTGNYSLDELPDLPAAFGPSVPPEGVSGLLMVSIPAAIRLIARAAESLRGPPSHRVQISCGGQLSIGLLLSWQSRHPLCLDPSPIPTCCRVPAEQMHHNATVPGQLDRSITVCSRGLSINNSSSRAGAF